MAESRTIRINSVDFTDLFTPRGYSVQYKKITGSNSGYMIDGSYIEDFLVVKTVVTLPVMPLSESDVASLLSEIYSNNYVMVYYFDPRQNGYNEITAVMDTDGMSSVYKGVGGTGVDYWSPSSIVLTEI